MSNTADNFRLADKHYLVDTFQQFEKVLRLFVICYYKMLEDKITLKLNEEFIRNVFLEKYVKKLRYQNQVEHMFFVPEPASIDENFETKGYFDILVLNIYPPSDFNDADESECFVFECKRLKMNEKNRDYINEGIVRFLDGKYEALMNGMIAFIEQNNGIELIIKNIEQKLEKHSTIQTTQFLEKFDLKNGFEFCRHSKHLKQGETHTEKEIYHLFFNYSTLVL